MFFNAHYKKLLVAIMLFVSPFVHGQTEADVKREMDKRGITTYEQVQEELRKRGMTEADARRQARLYGLDYDAYVQKYLVKEEATDTPNSLQSLTVDTTQYLQEIPDIAEEVAAPVEVDAPKSDGLKYFGYDLFTNNPYANQQALVGNIDPGYLIGPGDELRVYLWGEAEFQFEGKVDINGNLFIPNVGQVFVSGTTYENLNLRMKQYLSRFYSGLNKTPPKIFLDVSLTKLRPIRIVVMGESKNPGSQMINAFATTLNSLYASGGVKTSGSLREIKVFRNNKIISTIDLYDYIIKGSVSEDLRLMNNDVVFIPTRMNTISISGEVNTPGIFELKANEGLTDLIGFAGGLKPTAYKQTVTVKRIRSVNSITSPSAFDREIITLNYNELLENGTNFKLQDGDEIDFGKVLDKIDNMVTIAGSVFRPGDYQLEQVPTVGQLLTKTGGLRPRTYLDKIDLYRRDRNGDLKFQSLSLVDIMNNPSSDDNIRLQPDDSLKVYSLDELKTEDLVTIEGFLSEPKTILWRENLSLYDLIFMSANVEDLEYQNRILTSRADLLRYEAGETEYKVIPFNLDEVLDKKFNALLRPRDKVILYSREINEVLDTYVTIRGAVKNPGRYVLNDSMSIEDVILQAGGFLRKSFKDSVTISRENFDFTGNKIAHTTRLNTDMNYLLGYEAKSESTFLLQHNDFISVDYIPGSSEQREVVLVGEVKYPGTYFLESKGEKLSEIIERAGGLSPNVYVPGGRFYRNNQQLAFPFEELLLSNNDKADIILQPNDSIYFPESTYTVKVEGEVANPSLQKFVESVRVRSYLKNSGGRTKNGRRIYLTQPNGFTRRVKWLQNPVVLDGAVVTVAAKPVKERPNNGEFLKDFGTIMAIISSTMLSIAVIKDL
ncbi:SLBB domain-containing protein [Roseivirga pacifica]|uniref:SLBB domain-containing protein n=1 Tax=Roseivirga pacifica TaxID=1267423 RepID=UPI00227D5B89|nr:SLBB domain-containing protein [Roseivirga pacifica]